MLTYRWSPKTELTFQFEYGDERRDHDDGLIAPLGQVALAAAKDQVYNEEQDQDFDRGYVGGASFRHALRNGWNFRAAWRSVYFAGGRRNFEPTGVTATTPIANSVMTRRYRDQGNFRRYNFGDFNFFGDVVTGSVKHSLLLGLNGGVEMTYLPRFAFGPPSPPSRPPPPAANHRRRTESPRAPARRISPARSGSPAIAPATRSRKQATAPAPARRCWRNHSAETVRAAARARPAGAGGMRLRGPACD
jgi:hypothetical protein